MSQDKEYWVGYKGKLGLVGPEELKRLITDNCKNPEIFYYEFIKIDVRKYGRKRIECRVYVSAETFKKIMDNSKSPLFSNSSLLQSIFKSTLNKVCGWNVIPEIKVIRNPFFIHSDMDPDILLFAKALPRLDELKQDLDALSKNMNELKTTVSKDMDELKTAVSKDMDELKTAVSRLTNAISNKSDRDQSPERK